MTGKSKERPGVMLYFDAVRPAISRLDETQCGVLLRSVMDYAQYGVVPELDPMTGLAFDMLVPKIDRDAERYEESREQRQYAVYTREKKRSGEPVMSIGEWRLFRQREDEKKHRPDTARYRPVTICIYIHIHSHNGIRTRISIRIFINISICIPSRSGRGMQGGGGGRPGV